MKYRTGLVQLLAREGDFRNWELEGARLGEGGEAVLDPDRAKTVRIEGGARTRKGEPLYVGGEYLVGEAVSPELAAGFSFVDLLPSWDARTPRGSWIEVWLRAEVPEDAESGLVPAGRSWSDWYNLGVWAEDGSVVLRHSVEGQKDDHGSVATDTLSLRSPAAYFQIKVRFFGSADADPSLRSAAVAVSTAKPAHPEVLPRSGSKGRGRILEGVPEVSQMTYPDGGKVWCSPVAVSMVLGYWDPAGGSDEDRVREAVAGVYDSVFEGWGNWSFNAAYAAARGYEARVARFESLSRLEPYIASGIPVVLSVSWDEDKGRPLSGAPIRSSRGHLTLLVGFDPEGDPVLNEPAAPTRSEVRRTYKRSELEARWLEASGGAVYLIHPPGGGIK